MGPGVAVDEVADGGVSASPGGGDGGFFDKFDDYKEASRAYRRTVYGADEWRKHRSTKRYFRALQTSLLSGVLRGLALELVMIGAIAGAVVGLSAFGVFHPAIPALPLTLTAPALGLLITFRTNSAYGRWWEARKIWGAVINKTRDLTRQSHWFRNTERARKFSALAIAFGYALNAHCLKGTIPDPTNHISPHKSVDDKLEGELAPLVGQEKTDEILAAPHRPVEVCRLLTQCLAEEGLTPQLEARIDETIAFYSDFGGMCDRLQKTPMPLVYTRHTARALAIWLMLVPSALLGAGLSAPTIVISSLAIATLMFGIDELGVQIEEPFSVLPMDSYCNGLRALHDYATFVPSPNPPRLYM
eukprot:CAMPEP_0118905756 /NCGR_PEP_ID=MMETSP1166-20130328/9608_1 /TAXON_ID=1104430 /ORGANISM="Chrysoreinhardia sp, Strain CCMP3193" /LENGTH=358 /DNA_ID=CAMNT_0006845027 /DNA_START=44 /DNA_END=1121 /DNA_ORIENTATION=-